MPKRVFVDVFGNWHVLCTKKHKTAKCDRHHTVPESAIWQDDLHEDIFPDFVIQLRHARDKYRKDHQEWEEDCAVLRIASYTATEVFHKHIEAALAKTIAAEPKMAFELNHLWREWVWSNTSK